MSATPTNKFAIALHGGAGAIPRDMPEEEQAAHRAGLSRALDLGRAMLDRGAASLDVVEAVVRRLEDDPLFNAGKGSVFTHAGTHELDAAIMDGSSLACGAVAVVRTIKNPVTLARRVMERTPHVLLAGGGAEGFAVTTEVERVRPDYFDTDARRNQWIKARQREAVAGERGEDKAGFGTVGCVALDTHGHLAAATSTGGMTNKRLGRIGDTPIIGAGTYADDRACAVSCTGAGEQFIRHVIAFRVSALMTWAGRSLKEAADEAIHQTLNPGDGGLIAVDRAGNIAMPFNTKGMFRAAADSSGWSVVEI
jgi:beta-aspartyl-peptidase (threonine type)